jgi:hypothetical protein
MSTSPLGPYEYKGVIIDNAGCNPGNWNNHGSIVQFGDNWYVLYHRSTHGSRQMRKACIEPITFNEDGTYSFVDELTLSTEPAPTMALEIATSIEVKGAYTLEGDKLTLTPNLDTYKSEILSISMNGKVADNPMIKSQVGSMLKSADFKAQFGNAETLTVTIGDAALEMNDGEKSFNFVRFATIQN